MSWQEPKTDWVAGDVPGPGDFNRIEENLRLRVGSYIWTVPGVYNFTVPAGITQVWVSLAGGGGGGYTGLGGGGGGADAKIKQQVAVTPNEQITVTVASGGNPDSAGGTSSFGSYISAVGGGGGYQGNGGAAGGAGGVSGFYTPDLSPGGGSIFGIGGIKDGVNGRGYGGGGGRNAYGSQGFVLVEW
jgi:hypothetical protein